MYISGFRHNAGIKSIFPEPNGTKQIMLDVKASGYVFNPINDDLMIIRSFPENVKSVLWDNSVTDKEIFVVLDNNNNMHTFIINPDDVEEGGASVSCLGQTKVPQVQSMFFSKVIHICFSFWLLAHYSLDLSHAETKIDLVQRWTNSQK